MEYVFGTGNGGNETLKTKGSAHSNLSGWQQLERVYTDQTITDHFHVAGLIGTKTDAEGNVYDWYELDAHYRDTDKATARAADLQAQLDYIAMMTDVDFPEDEEDELS